MAVVLPIALSGGVDASYSFSKSSHHSHAGHKNVANVDVSSIDMVNKKIGWMTTPDAVFHTINGGASWINVSPHDISTWNMIAAECINAQSAWIAMSTNGAVIQIFHTHNGGRTWMKNQFQYVQFLNIHFINENTGWLTLLRGSEMMHESIEILKTKNGGIYWSQAAKTSQNNRPGRIPFAGDKTGSYFLNSRIGWVTGYTPENGVLYLYRTVDRGLIWNIQDIKVPRLYSMDQFISYPPKFFSKQNGILPVLANNTALLFYRTKNSGASWEPTKSIPMGSSQVVWDFVDARFGLVTNNKGIFETMDGGQSWSKITSNISFSNVKQLDFISHQEGWAVMMNGKLYKTTDGGRFWVRV
ncbi:WD40/YVTN/BNR-like repeat-containing protein [Ferroacidibacillus organovorans]|uniref:Photosynthesis system II assembly factor Ycf48/Hcf136-like domain-containing protein n=1 Tax=Ferroacidibacillus organovorans TaxID=1765683 RepID=A0A1V4ETI0_9BACL|nr:YCF48-related protein [Ferroacidibacillus organovorans]OPG16084.1 hypothetical protein B2M26_08550 [Ferroacidibacillus organovorans]